MKRGAENQLTKDADFDDDIQEVEPTQGFKKADEKVLAGRPIRGLPKRSQAITSNPLPTPGPFEAAPKFSGFSGFSSSASSSGFSFAPPTVSTLNKPSMATSAAPLASVSPFFSSNTPPVSSSASNATKTFASFLGATTPTPIPPETKAPLPSHPEDEIAVETKYFTALRGLNVSFLSAVSKAVESDPFLDVADLLERYKTLRVTAKTEYDDSLKKLKTSNTTLAVSLPTPPLGFTFGGSSFKYMASTDAKASNFSGSQPAPSLPTPPASFAGFPPPGTTSSTLTAGTGFVPKDDSSPGRIPSFFTFASTPSSVADNKATSAPTKSAFSFDKPPSAAASSSSNPSPFSFGGSSAGSKPGPTSLIFGSFSSSPSVFASNLFGKSDASKEEESKPESASRGASIFGGPASAFGTSSKPVSGSTSTGFSFGSAGAASATGIGMGAKPSPFGGFGKAGSPGSIGNPVGFNFGSPPPKTPEAETTSFPSSPKLSAFTFGAPPAFSSSSTLQVPDPDKDKDGESSVATSLEGTPAVEERPSSDPLATNSVHDLEGEGEEDEETAHEVRSKVYKLVKKSDGIQEWNDMGVGYLRIKKHKETGSRRVLLRNSSTGKIVINFNIYAGMNPVISKNVVSFVGHDHSDVAVTRGSATPFKLRVKTELLANDLKDALDKAIEALPSKSD